MKAPRLIVAIIGIVACSSCAHVRPQNKAEIPYEFAYVANEGEQVIRFLQDLELGLQRAPGLAWSGATRQPPIALLNRDALMIWVKKSWLGQGKGVRYLVEFRTVWEHPPFDGTLLVTSAGGCPQDQLSRCLEKVATDALKAGKKLPKY